MNKPILAMPRGAIVDQVAFGTDKLKREKFATTLTNYIDRLKMGAVISIDAPWGHGKTWFALNWKKRLVDNGHSVIYIDAFQSDYMEDPFLLLAAEISDLLKAGHKAKFISKAKDVALAIAPLTLKLAVQGAGKWALGSADISKEVTDTIDQAVSSSNDALGKMLEDRIKRHKSESQTISAFREALQQFAKKSTKPIVIIIDELDRCQPTFAVRLLERIKHLFDVENVVFVLCMNKQQMGQAIQGVYGQGTDAHTYLEKFLNFTFSLNPVGRNELLSFVYAEFDKYEIQKSADVEDFLRALAILSEIFELTPRQIEKCIALLALAYPFGYGGELLAQVIVLKVARPSVLAAVLKNDLDALVLLEKQLIIGTTGKGIGRRSQVEFLLAAIGAAANPNSGDKQTALINYHVQRDEVFNVIRTYAQSVDVPID